MIGTRGAVISGLVLALATATNANARMSIGETRPFSMDTPAVWQTANYLLRQKSAGRYMAVGGSIKRVGEDSYLLCGFSIDMHRQGQKKARPVGFVIMTDNAGNHGSVTVSATEEQQEAAGCWPEERKRLEQATRQLSGSAGSEAALSSAPGQQ